MPTTQQWFKAASASLEAAKSLQESFPASAVSRAYYSAYQIVHAAMISFRLNPPQGRVNWGHDTTLDLFRNCLIKSPAFQQYRPQMRQALASLVALLRYRIVADYTLKETITAQKAKDLVRQSDFIFNLIRTVVLKEEK
jgi:uncharacterized protein (UPF0332 family)